MQSPVVLADGAEQQPLSQQQLLSGRGRGVGTEGASVLALDRAGFRLQLRQLQAA